MIVRAGRRRRWFVPLPLVVLLLSPLLVLALLAGLVACVIFRVNPAAALLGLGRVLWALPGTRIDIDDGHTPLYLSIR